MAHCVSTFVNPAREFKSVTVSCFEVSIARLWTELELAFAAHHMNVESKHRPLAYEDFGPDPIAGGAFPRRAGLLSRSLGTAPATILITNMMDGWMTLGYIGSERCRCRCWQFTVCQAVEYPRNGFSLIENGNDVRNLYAWLDTKWEFTQRGAAIPIEDTAMYEKRAIKHRVPREYVLSLAARAGFPLADDAFWRTDDSDLCFYDRYHQRRT